MGTRGRSTARPAQTLSISSLSTDAGTISKSRDRSVQEVLDGIVNGCRVRTEFTKRRGQRQLPGQRQPLDTWIVRTQTVKFLHVGVGRIRKSLAEMCGGFGGGKRLQLQPQRVRRRLKEILSVTAAQDDKPHALR